MKFSLLEITFWYDTEWWFSIGLIETPTGDGALFSIGRLEYLKEWQFDFLYYNFWKG